MLRVWKLLSCIEYPFEMIFISAIQLYLVVISFAHNDKMNVSFMWEAVSGIPFQAGVN